MADTLPWEDYQATPTATAEPPAPAPEAGPWDDYAEPKAKQEAGPWDEYAPPTAPEQPRVRRTPQELADDPDFDPITHIAENETDADEVNNAVLADQIQRKKGITVGGAANTAGRFIKALPGAIIEGGGQMIRGYAKAGLNLASNAGKRLQGYTMENDEQFARNARELNAGLASGTAAFLKMGEAAEHNLTNLENKTGLRTFNDLAMLPTGIPLIRALIDKYRSSGSKTPVQDARRDYLIRQAAYLNQIKEYEGGHIPSDTEGKREGVFGTIPQPVFKDEADKAQFTRNIQDIAEGPGDLSNIVPGMEALAPAKWVAKGGGKILRGLGKGAEAVGEGTMKVGARGLKTAKDLTGTTPILATAGGSLPVAAKAAAIGGSTWLGGKLVSHLGGMAREVGEELATGIPTRGDSFYRRTMKGAIGGATTGTLGSLPMLFAATSPEEAAGMIGPAPVIGGGVGGAHAGIGARSTERIARFEALAKDGEARPYATGDEAAAAAQQMNKLDAGAQKLINYWRGHFQGATNPNGQEITPVPISRADFVAQHGRGARGNYDANTGRLYIVIDDANGNIYSADKLAESLAHESSHGLNAAMRAAQPDAHKAFTDGMRERLAPGGTPTPEFQQWMDGQIAQTRDNYKSAGKTDAEIDAAMQGYDLNYWLEEAPTDISQGILTGEGLDRFTLTPGMTDRIWDSIKDTAAKAGIALPNARAQGALDAPASKQVIKELREQLYQRGEEAIARLDQRQAQQQAARQAAAARAVSGRKGGAAAQEAAKPWTPPPPEFQAVAQQAHDAVLATKPVKKDGTHSIKNQRLAKKAAFDAVAAAHAASVPADYDGIKMTVSPLGFPEVSGKLQPGRPFDDWLIDQAKLTPEQVQTILNIQNAAGDTISIKYRHAEGNPGQPNYRATRRAAQERQPARFRAVNDEGQIETKIFQPQKPKFNWLSKTFTILGVNNEKFLGNFAWAEEAMQHHGIAVPYRDIHDPRIVADIKGLQANHAQGLTWDARPITGLSAYPGATNAPTGTGVPYRGFLDASGKPDTARFEFLNLLLGNEGARTGKRRETAIQRAKRELGELNREPGGAPVLGGGETNTLREKLNTLMGEQDLVNWRGEPVPGKARWSELFMEDPLNEAISVDNIVEVNPTVERGMSPLHEHQYSGDLQRHFGNLRPENMEQERIAAAGRFMPEEPSELMTINGKIREISGRAVAENRGYTPDEITELTPLRARLEELDRQRQSKQPSLTQVQAMERMSARASQQPTLSDHGPYNDEFTLSYQTDASGNRRLFTEYGKVPGFRTREAAQAYIDGNSQLEGYQVRVEEPRVERRRRLPAGVREGQFTVVEGRNADGRNRWEVVDSNGELHNWFSSESRARSYAEAMGETNAGRYSAHELPGGEWQLVSPEHGYTGIRNFPNEAEARQAAREHNKATDDLIRSSPHVTVDSLAGGGYAVRALGRDLGNGRGMHAAMDAASRFLRENPDIMAEITQGGAAPTEHPFVMRESQLTPGEFAVVNGSSGQLAGTYPSRVDAMAAVARAADMTSRGLNPGEIGTVLRRQAAEIQRGGTIQTDAPRMRLEDIVVENRGGNNWTARIGDREVAHGRDQNDVLSAASMWAREHRAEVQDLLAAARPQTQAQPQRRSTIPVLPHMPQPLPEGSPIADRHGAIEEGVVAQQRALEAQIVELSNKLDDATHGSESQRNRQILLDQLIKRRDDQLSSEIARGQGNEGSDMVKRFQAQIETLMGEINKHKEKGPAPDLIELAQARNQLVGDFQDLHNTREYLRRLDPQNLRDFPVAFEALRHLETRAILTPEEGDALVDKLTDRQIDLEVRDYLAKESPDPKVRVAEAEALRERLSDRAELLRNAFKKALWETMLRAKDMAGAAKVVKFWRNASRDDALFSHPRTTASEPEAIAREISTPKTPVTAVWTHNGRTIDIRAGKHHYEITGADTKNPQVYSASGKNEETSGGSTAYLLAHAWALANGKQLTASGSLTEINAFIRRTSNMAASAIRFQTTRHMLPDRSQGMVGWIDQAGMKPDSAESKAADVHNTALLLMRESDVALKQVPPLQGMSLDLRTGKIKDADGNEVTGKKMNQILEDYGEAHTYKKGIGKSTAQRAIITKSLLAEAEGRLAKNDPRVAARMAQQQKGSVYMPEDASYAKAVEAGDKKSEQRLVNAAARRAGYNVMAAHSTNATDFNEFRTAGLGAHFGTEKSALDRAEHLRSFSEDVVGREHAPARVIPVALKIQNPLEMPDLAGIDTRSGLPIKEAMREFRQKYPSRKERQYREDSGDAPNAGAWESESDFQEHLLHMGVITSDEFWDVQYDTDAAVELLKEKGYDGIVYRNVVEAPGSKSYIAFDPNQIKRRDATRDEAGNPIPLSQRFNPEKTDLRYMPEENDASYLKAAEAGDTKTAQELVDRAAKAAGYTLETWRGESSGGEHNDFGRRREPGIFTSQNKDFASEYADRGRGEPRRFYVKADKRLNLESPDLAAYKWMDKWGKEYMEGDKHGWRDPQTGEETDAASIIAGGRMFDYEGDWSSRAWKDLQRSAKADGFDVLIAPDAGGVEDSTSTIVLNDRHIKLADPITHDDAGRVIPPSERFNTQERDIRYMPEDRTETPAFKRWSGGAPVHRMGEGGLHDVPSDQPVVIEGVHGTTHDFKIAQPEGANIENDFGKGFYVSTAHEDVGTNYAGEGPDLTGRIERKADRIQNDLFNMDLDEIVEQFGITPEQAKLLTDTGSFIYNSPEAKERDAILKDLARKDLTSHGGATMKVFVKMERPLRIGGREEYWDTNFNEDENGDIVGEPTGKMADFVEYLRSEALNYDAEAEDTSELQDLMIDGASVSKAIAAAKEAYQYATDENGDVATNEIIRGAIENMGYDGIIDTTVSEKFSNMKGMDEDTAHVIAFKPEQIKSATGNVGTYDPKNPDMTYMPEGEVPRSSVKHFRKAPPAIKEGKIGMHDVARWLTRENAAQGKLEEFTPENKRAIAAALFDEARHALSKDKNAVGWYDAKVKEAFEIIHEFHPELKKDKDLGSLYKALMAITSNGQTVFDNFARADALYEQWRETGSFETDSDWGGKTAPAINTSLKLLKAMIEDRGLTKTREFLQSEMTARDLGKIGVKINGEQADTKLKGANMFGPKIGSFYGNLNGDFSSVTMDRWFMRTFNRIVGNLTDVRVNRVPGQVDRVLGAMSGKRTDMGFQLNEVKDGLRKLKKAAGKEGVDLYDEIDPKLLEYLEKKYNAFAASGFKDRSDFNMGTKVIFENIYTMREAPETGTQRTWIREVMAETQRLLSNAGHRISNADLQALLWFYEKQLYSQLGFQTKRGAPADYADAARELAAARKLRGTGRGERPEGAGPARSGAGEAQPEGSGAANKPVGKKVKGRPQTGAQEATVPAPAASQNRPDVKAGARQRIEARGQFMPESEGFKKWTRDTKVVEDAKEHSFTTGEPVTVKAFHGGAERIDTFDLGKTEGVRDPQERGIYFMTTREMPERYAKMATQMGRGKTPTVTDAYVQMKNPYVGPRTSFKQMRADGYDGWIGQRPNSNGEVEIAVFNPNQIKSATENSGAYDPSSSDIRYMPEEFTPTNEPNKPYAKIPSDAVVKAALVTSEKEKYDKRGKYAMARSTPRGTQVGLRIDIPTYEASAKKGDPVYAVTVHEGKSGGKVGKVIGYDSMTAVDDPVFWTAPGIAIDQIAAGVKDKFPAATVEGKFNPSRTMPKDINDWTPVGFDPRKADFFYDKRTGKKVTGGTRAISVGNTVFVKSPTYEKLTPPLKAGVPVSAVREAAQQRLKAREEAKQKAMPEETGTPAPAARQTRPDIKAAARHRQMTRLPYSLQRVTVPDRELEPAL